MPFAGPIRRPFGAWPSSIVAEQVVSASVRLGQPQLTRDAVWWLEGRPAEGGRQVVVRADRGRGGAGRADVTPPDTNVRTLVHEYGGGDYLATDEALFYSNFEDQRVHRLSGGDNLALTKPGVRYADFALSPDGRWLLAVEEQPDRPVEPLNRIVALDLHAALENRRPPKPVVVADGHHFYSFPRFSPSGDRFTYTAWDHPHMPWDGTWLYLRPWRASGPAAPPMRLPSGARDSMLEPRFSPSGRLTFISDRNGWWNLYQYLDPGFAPLCRMHEEFAGPQWVFGLSHYDFEVDDVIVCVRKTRAGDRLARLWTGTGAMKDIPVPYTSIGGLQISDGTAVFIGSSDVRTSAVVELDLATGRYEEIAVGSSAPLDPSLISRPEAIEFESVGGRRAYAYFYAPHNPDCVGPEGGRPPLLVKSHGGPTAAASPALDPRIQFWTSRGFAVVDVDYGGSTGYGRAYRDSLKGQWGIVDVEDCIAAAQGLAAEGRVDGEHLAISGGSAGGYTTLCALTFHDVFAAGASHYGIGDLEALVRDTHKFESQYMDQLVGPYPAQKALYRERSPIHSPEKLNCPVIFFQGLEDRIVPPNQAEAMVKALRKRRIPHAYVPFPGEQHGFRRAQNVCTALNGELYFYSRIFGFDCGPAPEGVELVGV